MLLAKGFQTLCVVRGYAVRRFHLDGYVNDVGHDIAKQGIDLIFVIQRAPVAQCFILAKSIREESLNEQEK